MTGTQRPPLRGRGRRQRRHAARRGRRQGAADRAVRERQHQPGRRHQFVGRGHGQMAARAAGRAAGSPTARGCSRTRPLGSSPRSSRRFRSAIRRRSCRRCARTSTATRSASTSATTAATRSSRTPADCPGYVSRVAMIPDLHVGVAVLTNQESGEAFDSIAFHVLDHYLGAPAFDWIDGYTKVHARDGGKHRRGRAERCRRHATPRRSRRCRSPSTPARIAMPGTATSRLRKRAASW